MPTTECNEQRRRAAFDVSGMPDAELMSSAVRQLALFAAVGAVGRKLPTTIDLVAKLHVDRSAGDKCGGTF